MMPRTLSELYLSEWLRYDDLYGRSFVLTISDIEVRKFKYSMKPDDWQLVLSFEGAEKRLICNKTQATSIAEIARTEAFTEWVGVRVTLRPGMTRNRKPTILVTPAPLKKAEAPPPIFDEEE